MQPILYSLSNLIELAVVLHVVQVVGVNRQHRAEREPGRPLIVQAVQRGQVVARDRALVITPAPRTEGVMIVKPGCVWKVCLLSRAGAMPH